MMKRIVCAVVLAVMLAGAASGKVQDFGDFTADVPYGWRAKKQDDGTFKLGDKESLCTSLSFRIPL